MSLPVMLLLEGLAYAVVFSGLSLVRQEKLSLRLAIETLLITLAVSGGTALSGYPTHPVLFLFGVYLVTMRVRLLVDVGNAFARRGRYPQAEALYGLAARLGPDPVGAIVLDLNRAAMLLQRGKTDEAIAALTGMLEKSKEGHVGPRHEAAVHYNLGAAYRRTGKEAQAIREFNAAVDAWPVSPYARRAEEALDQNRRKRTGPPSG
ncbi:MAG: tetratricopeptide repeat protein [Chloroflexi bacterium]|nr:tetratricopeptide repeat protein [Chloroflexota bacterium]